MHNMPAGTKALMFEQNLRAAAQELRDRALKVGVVVGSDLLDDEDREGMVQYKHLHLS